MRQKENGQIRVLKYESGVLGRYLAARVLGWGVHVIFERRLAAVQHTGWGRPASA